MLVSDLLRRSAVAVEPHRTVAEAASIMSSAGVGAVVVAEDDRPLGIVTDRDLVRRGLARSLPPDARVDSVMSAPLITVGADDDAHRVYEVLRNHALRRLPVVRDGRLVGVVTVDDLIIHLSSDLSDLVRPITGEVFFPQRDPSPPVTVTAVRHR